MTATYNACLRTGRFPVNWKIAKILPIAKPGREECRHVKVPPNQLNKYRRVSTGKATKQKNNTPPIHDRILKRKPIRIHIPKEYGRCRHAN